MENIVSKLKNNWILFIIILQPVLDIVSYFQMKYIGNSYSWIIRVALVAIVVFISFVASKDKKKFILKISPFALFFIIHMANLYRIHKISIIEDTKYFILVFQIRRRNRYNWLVFKCKYSKYDFVCIDSLGNIYGF